MPWNITRGFVLISLFCLPWKHGALENVFNLSIALFVTKEGGARRWSVCECLASSIIPGLIVSWKISRDWVQLVFFMLSVLSIFLWHMSQIPLSLFHFICSRFLSPSFFFNKFFLQCSYTFFFLFCFSFLVVNYTIFF